MVVGSVVGLSVGTVVGDWVGAFDGVTDEVVLGNLVGVHVDNNDGTRVVVVDVGT